MSNDEFLIWKKEDNKKYEIDIVFMNNNLEITINDSEIQKKVKGFEVTSYKDSLLIMLHFNNKYYGYYYSTYISSNLLDINKIIGHLEDSKIKQLDIYLE